MLQPSLRRACSLHSELPHSHPWRLVSQPLWWILSIAHGRSLWYSAALPSQRLGVPLGTFLGEALGWRSAFAAVGLFGLFAVAACAWSVPRLPGQRRNGAQEVKELAAQPAVLGALSVTPIQTTAQFVVYTLIGPYLYARLGLSGGAIGFVLLAFGIASVIGNFLGGTLSDRFGERRTLLISLAGLSAAFLGLAATPASMTPIIAALMAWGLFGFMFQAPQQSRLVRLAPMHSNAILSLNAASIYLGTAAGAVLAGFGADLGGFDVLPLLGFDVAVMATVLLYLTWSAEARIAAPVPIESSRR